MSDLITRSDDERLNNTGTVVRISPGTSIDLFRDSLRAAIAAEKEK